MIKLEFFRNHSEDLIKNFKKRNINIDLDEAYTVDKFVRSGINQINTLKAAKNKLTSLITQSTETKQESIKLTKQIENLESSVLKSKDWLNQFLSSLPNILDESVPEGNNSSENKIIRQTIIKKNSQTIIPHYDIIDHNLIHKAVEMSSSRFIGLSSKIATLYRAISSFLADFLLEQGFTEVYLPFILNKEAFFKSGHVPSFEDNIFWLEGKELGLVPTAEASIANLYQGHIFKDIDLPTKVFSFSPCFRKEAGSAGKDTKGLIRLHQFQKVEMFQFVKPEESNQRLEEMVQFVEKALNALELPHRVVLLCGGDTGICSTKTYDLEVYMPSRDGKYCEISSCSNCKDFQSTRSKIKNNSEFVHMLNGSCLPLERTLAAIIENHQLDRKIIIPSVLRKYVNFTDIDF